MIHARTKTFNYVLFKRYVRSLIKANDISESGLVQDGRK